MVLQHTIHTIHTMQQHMKVGVLTRRSSAHQIVKGVLSPLCQFVHIVVIGQVCSRAQLQGFSDLLSALTVAAPILQLLPSFPQVACMNLFSCCTGVAAQLALLQQPHSQHCDDNSNKPRVSQARLSLFAQSEKL